MTAPGWRLLVGCDDAGLDYKTRIMQRLEQDTRVASAIDVGIHVDGDGRS